MAALSFFGSFSDESLVGIRPLWQEFNEELVSIDELRTRFQNSASFVYVIGEKNVFVAFASGMVRFSAIRPTPFFELEALYVKKDSRRMGWGTALVMAMKDNARKMQCEAIHLSGIINEDARAFYASQGFQIYADRRILKLKTKCQF
jgi:GNAT superfamily N-acetyltransferase